jgi:cysteine synthase B
MLERAEEDGLIRPGQTILEPDLRQHRHLAGDDLPAQGLSAQGRHAGQRDPGAHPAAPDVRRGDRLLAGRAGLERRGGHGARDGEADSSYYMPYQYGNPANPDAHYHGTAVEILEELDT